MSKKHFDYKAKMSSNHMRFVKRVSALTVATTVAVSATTGIAAQASEEKVKNSETTLAADETKKAEQLKAKKDMDTNENAQVDKTSRAEKDQEKEVEQKPGETTSANKGEATQEGTHENQGMEEEAESAKGEKTVEDRERPGDKEDLVSEQAESGSDNEVKEEDVVQEELESSLPDTQVVKTGKNKSLITHRESDYSTSHENVDTLGLVHLSLNTDTKDYVSIDMDEVERLTYAVKFTKPVFDALEKGLSNEWSTGVQGAHFKMVTLNEDGIIESLPADEDFVNKYTTYDRETSSVYFDIQGMLEAANLKIDQKLDWAWGEHIFFELDPAVKGTHTIKFAYTDGQVDLDKLENKPNQLVVNFDEDRDMFRNSSERNDPKGSDFAPKGNGSTPKDSDKTVKVVKTKEKSSAKGSKTAKKADTKDKQMKKAKDSKGKELPNTATSTWMYGVAGVTIALLGVALKLIARMRRTVQ